MYFSQTIICIAKGKVIENRLRKSQKILQLLKNNATTKLNIQNSRNISNKAIQVIWKKQLKLYTCFPREQTIYILTNFPHCVSFFKNKIIAWSEMSAQILRWKSFFRS